MTDPVLLLVIAPLAVAVLTGILIWLFETRRYRRSGDGALIEIDAGGWFSGRSSRRDGDDRASDDGDSGGDGGGD